MIHRVSANFYAKLSVICLCSILVVCFLCQRNQCFVRHFRFLLCQKTEPALRLKINEIIQSTPVNRTLPENIVHAIFTRHMYMQYVHAICTRNMYTQYVHVICTRNIYTKYVHAICTRNILRMLCKLSKLFATPLENFRDPQVEYPCINTNERNLLSG